MREGRGDIRQKTVMSRLIRNILSTQYDGIAVMSVTAGYRITITSDLNH